MIIWQRRQVLEKTLPDGTDVLRWRSECTVLHEDIIGDGFWRQHPGILAD